MSKSIIILSYDSTELPRNFQVKLLERCGKKVGNNVIIVEVDDQINEIDSFQDLCNKYHTIKKVHKFDAYLVIFSITGKEKILIKQELVDSLSKAIQSSNYLTRVVCVSQAKLTAKELEQQLNVFSGYMIDQSAYPIDLQYFTRDIWGHLTKGLNP